MSAQEAEVVAAPVVGRANAAELRRLISEGALSDAVDLAETILAGGGDAEIYGLLGYVHQQAQRFEAAAQACARAVELGSEDWSIYLILAASLRSLERHDEAIAPAWQAFGLSPQRIDAATVLLEVVTVAQGLPQARALLDTAPDEMREALRGAWPLAMQAYVRRLVIADDELLCREALAFHEDSALYRALGHIHQRAGRSAEAVAAWGRAVELGADDWLIRLLLSASLRERGPDDGGLPTARGAFAAAPGSVNDAARLLDVLAQDGPSAAQGAVETASGAARDTLLKAWPIAMAAHVHRLVEAGDLERAKDACYKALAVQQSGLLWLYLGDVEVARAQPELAAEAYERAAQNGAEDASRYLVLGLDLRENRLGVAARVAFKNALRLDPCRIDAALPLLEEVLNQDGLDVADDLYRSYRDRFDDPALEARWRQLVDDHLPPSIPALMAAGKIDEAEAECRAALEKLKTRKLDMTLRHIGAYRDWLAFTSSRRSRDDPDRKPSISVFVITYNHGRYIAQALDSILMQQTDYPLEINVIDDASTDDTQAIVLDYQNKHPGLIHTYFNATNVGTLDPPQQKVTYEGYKTLKGDYFALLEGDDYWSSPHKLQTQVDFLEANPLYAMSVHNTVKIYEDKVTEPHRFFYWRRAKSTFTIDDATEMNMFFHLSSAVFRNVFHGEPPRHFASKWSCDMYWSMAHMEHGFLDHLDEDWSVYRAHAGGSWSNLPPLKHRVFHIEALLRYNSWMQYRYLKSISLSINRVTLQLLKDERAGLVQSLSNGQRLRYRLIAKAAGWIYDLIDRHPGLDPAVFRFKEPRKLPRPRSIVLAGYGLA